MNEKKQDEQKLQQPQTKKMRQIIIETDGNIARILKAEVAGSLELKAILQGLIDVIKK